ncbi:MAG: hypothetical protein Q4P18_07295 [Methanobrevibacter sp.]|uniref:hypothetical protein n=1 Tax=Methanobrevibacter sp. TaxID=66852 RepID=UPI0026DFA64F|nr:hypothetical protein [Methanobrevibacter sp.]MDO5849323.1 hypothetical protein [Methanobrevibacter sp.]
MNCKYMRTKYNYTPNDYDIYFNYEDIPSNIKLKDIVGLSYQLQRVMPLTKKVHLQFNTTNKEYTSRINVYTTLSVNKHEVKIQ